MIEWLNKIRNKQFRIHIEYGFVDFEFIIKRRTIMAAIVASLFFAVVFTFRAIMGKF